MGSNFTHNSASYGGAVYWSDTGFDGNLKDSIFTNNDAASNAGAVQWSGS